jgi:hypothetical protein
MTLGGKNVQEPLVIDIEVQRSCGCVQVGAVNEKSDTLLWVKNHVPMSFWIEKFESLVAASEKKRR